MKLFLVSRGWPTEKEPQWGSFERDQAIALKEYGHQVILLSVDVRAKWGFRKYGISRKEENGIPIYNLYAGPFWGKISRILSVSFFKGVKRKLFLHLLDYVIKKEGLPDLLYTHYFGNTEMGLVGKWKRNIPLVGIEHFSALGASTLSKGIKERAEVCYKYVDQLLTVSSSLRDNILKQLSVDSIVVPNMVGPEFCYKGKDQSDKVRFISTGNLLPVKGYNLLIEAFYRANLPEGSWSLDIIGSGPEKNKLNEQIIQQGLTDQIHLRGRLDRERVISYLQESDVYVLSSILETFGVAAIEAQACGLPVIATKCGGPKEFMNDQNGVMCPVGDVNKLSQAIEWMFEHYLEYDNEKIAEDCYHRFSGKAIAEQLTIIFEAVLRKGDIQ